MPNQWKKPLKIHCLVLTCKTVYLLRSRPRFVSADTLYAMVRTSVFHYMRLLVMKLPVPIHMCVPVKQSNNSTTMK